MVKVYCDMCLREIDYEKDGVNLDFNRFGTVRFKQGQDLEKQLCKSCAGIIFYMGYDVFRDLVERGRITPLSPEGEETLEART